MDFDIFAMMKEEQEKQQPKKAPEQLKKETGINIPKTKEKPVKAKNIGKKDVKKKTFDEQYAEIKDMQLKMLVDHLLTLDGMKEKMEHPDVTIEGMYSYCKDQARKKATNGFYFRLDNEELYGWGRHYYDEHGNVAE